MNLDSDTAGGLRRGFSTGACAAAAAKVASLHMQGAFQGKSVEVVFPDGKIRSMDVACYTSEDNTLWSAGVIKDAGDDPDVTNRAMIRATLRQADFKDATTCDFIITIGNATIVLRGGDGVGFVTKCGLEVPKGKWAINSSPREMIERNIAIPDMECEGEEQRYFLLEISVDNGEAIAQKTLNPALGIVGGVSILGSSGIVEPHSHAAYIKTICTILRSISLEGQREVVFTTGNRTRLSALQDIDWIPEVAFIRIGDFIADALKGAEDVGIEKLSIACMPGKLFKYALGIKNTHAHKSEVSMHEMLPFFKRVLVSEDTIEALLSCQTVREVGETMDHDEYVELLKELAEEALGFFLQWVPLVTVELLVYSNSGDILTRAKREKRSTA